MTEYFFSRTGVPLSKPEDIIPFLGKKIHWREGRSAYEAAYSWFDAKGSIPKSVLTLIETDPAFANAKLVKAIFEEQTVLDSYRRPSQTDVLAILRIQSGPAVLGIEAKVDETFGEIVREWKDRSESKRHRLDGLIKCLRLESGEVISLRYQLLHRTVATLLEAKRHGADDAALIVQSFCPKHSGFSDFQAFAAALNVPISERGTLSSPIERNGIRLRLGWAEDRIRVEPPTAC